MMINVCNISEAGDEAGITRKTAFCPRVWDGLQCWPATAAGQLAVRPCPHYIDNFIIDGLHFTHPYNYM